TVWALHINQWGWTQIAAIGLSRCIRHIQPQIIRSSNCWLPLDTCLVARDGLPGACTAGAGFPCELSFAGSLCVQIGIELKPGSQGNCVLWADLNGRVLQLKRAACEQRNGIGMLAVTYHQDIQLIFTVKRACCAEGEAQAAIGLTFNTHCSFAVIKNHFQLGGRTQRLRQLADIRDHNGTGLLNALGWYQIGTNFQGIRGLNTTLEGRGRIAGSQQAEGSKTECRYY